MPVPPQSPGLQSSDSHSTTTVSLQLSVACGKTTGMDAPHCTLESAGTDVQLGGVVSTWVTTCVWLAVLPQASEAKNVFKTVYMPEETRPKVSANHVTSTSEQLSTAVGHRTSMLDSQLTAVSMGSIVQTGGIKSKKTAAVIAVLWLPQASVAVYVRMTSEAGEMHPCTETSSLQVNEVSSLHPSNTTGCGKASMLSPQFRGQNATALSVGGVSSTWVWVWTA